MLKGLFGRGPTGSGGRDYKVNGLEGLPKPLRRPHPPLLIGGGGAAHLVARGTGGGHRRVERRPRRRRGVGDYFAGGAAGGPFDEKIGWVREAAGERFDDLELNTCLTEVIVTDDVGKAAAMAARYGVNVAAVLDTPDPDRNGAGDRRHTAAAA